MVINHVVMADPIVKRERREERREIMRKHFKGGPYAKLPIFFGFNITKMIGCYCAISAK